MRVAILGAGAWGTALGCALASRCEVALWARSAEQAERMLGCRRNERYLPGIELPPRLAIETSLNGALEHAGDDGLVLLASPMAGLRPLAAQLRRAGTGAPVAWLCKGLERDTGLFAHQVLEQELPGRDAGPLSGPSFAEEVARGLPTAMVIAGAEGLRERVTRALHGGNLRIYSSADVIGVEVGGAVKNVMAIATGISDALGLGNNARAALITRGLAETQRLGEALGARSRTLTGLAGLGDLILTCTGELSRNRRVGLALGRGVALDSALAGIGHVAEGVWSAPEVAARARAAGIEMPLTDAVCAVLDGRLTPGASLERLLARDPRPEHA
ncbi:MAG TPA: NAD(P)H-dependent glycerol-3-phosphate dehydrogenase [Burkholderiaceae bacterium]